MSIVYENERKANIFVGFAEPSGWYSRYMHEEYVIKIHAQHLDLIYDVDKIQT